MASNDPQPPSSAQTGARSESADVARTALDDKSNCLPVGTRLGEFEIVGLVGEGGFGIVYEAVDHQLQRSVAIKEYMPSAMATRSQGSAVVVKAGRHAETFEAGLRSFVNEARLLAQFDHPSLVKVFRFWEANGTAYMAMPLYRGETLREALRSFAGAPDEPWLRRLLAPLLDALETLHEAHCFHRDIAPDNILLLGNGRPVLLDFGAARRVIGDMTQALTVILKPGYAPMEQYANGPEMPQGPWTDVYALAAVVYYCITGKAPPPSVSRLMRDTMVPAQEAGRGRYAEDFLHAIDHALAVTIENRTQSIAELRSELGLEGDGASQATTAFRVPRSTPGTTTPREGDATSGGSGAAPDATTARLDESTARFDESTARVGDGGTKPATMRRGLRDDEPTLGAGFAETTGAASFGSEPATQHVAGPRREAPERPPSPQESPPPPEATVLVRAAGPEPRVQIRNDERTRLLRAPDRRRESRARVVAASALVFVVVAGVAGWIALRGADGNRAAPAAAKIETGPAPSLASASSAREPQPTAATPAQSRAGSDATSPATSAATSAASLATSPAPERPEAQPGFASTPADATAPTESSLARPEAAPHERETVPPRSEAATPKAELPSSKPEPAEAEAPATRLARSSPGAESSPVSAPEPAPTRDEPAIPPRPEPAAGPQPERRAGVRSEAASPPGFEAPAPPTAARPPPPKAEASPPRAEPPPSRAELPAAKSEPPTAKSEPPPPKSEPPTPKAEPPTAKAEPAPSEAESRAAKPAAPVPPKAGPAEVETRTASRSARTPEPSRAPELALALPSLEPPAAKRAPPFSAALALDEIYDARETDWKIDVRVDRPSVRIEKDRFGFHVRSSRSGYLYLLMLGTDGRHLYLLFPNALDDDNRVRANAELRLPRASWAIVASGPPGTNRMLALVSPVRRDFKPAGLGGSGSIGEFDLRSAERAFSEHGALALAGKPAGCSSANTECGRYGAAQFEILEVR